jgi:hypothetical protein
MREMEIEIVSYIQLSPIISCTFVVVSQDNMWLNLYFGTRNEMSLRIRLRIRICIENA